MFTPKQDITHGTLYQHSTHCNMWASHPYVCLVRSLVDGIAHLTHGERRDAIKLAISVVEQGLTKAVPFAPGMTVRRTTVPYDAQVVIGCKPIGYPGQNWFDYYANKMIHSERPTDALLWTTEPNGGGQSLASEWTKVVS